MSSTCNAVAKPMIRAAAMIHRARKTRFCHSKTTGRHHSSNRCRRTDIPYSSHTQHHNQRAAFSSWSGRGHDFLGDSFLGGDRPKVLLESIAPSGFDVSNLLKKIDPNEQAPHGALHMTGSILVFPNACFLWRIESPDEITAESLSPVLLHRPKLDYLFIGTRHSMDQEQLIVLKRELKEKANIVVEWLPLAEAMSTFNILNGEDRMVAVALVIDRDESNYFDHSQTIS